MVASRAAAEPMPGLTDALPLTLEPRPPVASTAAGAAFIAIAAAILLTPFLMLLTRATIDPGVLKAALRHPLTVLLLALGLITASAFVVIPLRRLVVRATRPRRIVVAQTGVHATNGEKPAWSEPLSAYRGVAHHIRTSLSGTQHEIVLVHPESAKTVVLHTAARIAQPEIDRVASMLNLSEVPARDLYARRPEQRLAPVLEAA